MIDRRKIRPAEDGQSNIEYALLIVLVAVIVILVLAIVGRGVQGTFQNITTAIAFDLIGTSEVTPKSDSTENSTQELTPTPEAASSATPTRQPGSGDNTTPGSNPTSPPVNPTSVPTASAGDTSGTDHYFDPFDGSGNIHWQNSLGTWAATNRYFTSTQFYSKVVGDIPFSNYDFTADVQTTRKGPEIGDVTMVLFRVQSVSSFYAVMLKQDGVVELAKNNNGQWQGWLSVTATHLNSQDNLSFRVKAFGNHIQVFIDNKKVVDYRDADPILSGGIGFTNNNSIGRVDNVEVNRRAQE